MNNLFIETVKGFKDLDGKIAFIIKKINEICENIVKKYGCMPLETPIVEREELFIKSLGNTSDIVTKEIFRLISANDYNLILRPEQTCSVVRWAIKNRLDLKGQPRVYSFGPMFRHENPQKGRWRQFNQFNIEFVNNKNPLNDIELLLMTNDIINEIITYFNLPKNFFLLKINTIGTLSDRNQYSEYLQHQIINNPLFSQEAQWKALKNPLRVLDTKNLNDFNQLESLKPLKDFINYESYKNFENLTKLLEHNNIKFSIDNYLIRGLDYYNDLVFEWVVNDDSIIKNAIIAGGRYDNLAYYLTNKYNLANIGCALGVDRLADYLSPYIHDIPQKIIPIINLDASNEYVLQVAQALRKYCGVQILNPKKLQDNFKFINNNLNIFKPLVIILGNHEEMEKSLSIKFFNQNNNTHNQKLSLCMIDDYDWDAIEV